MDKTKIYLFRYFYKGSWWSLEIPAASREDAEERLRNISSSSEFDGVLEMELEISSVN